MRERVLEIPTAFGTAVATGMGDDRRKRKEHSGGDPMKRRTVLTGLGISTLAASLTPRMLRTALAGADSLEPELLELRRRVQ